MLQSMGSQRVRHDLMTEQHQQQKMEKSVNQLPVDVKGFRDIQTRI